jgi:hypothetical protein
MAREHARDRVQQTGAVADLTRRETRLRVVSGSGPLEASACAAWVSTSEIRSR